MKKPHNNQNNSDLIIKLEIDADQDLIQQLRNFKNQSEKLLNMAFQNNVNITEIILSRALHIDQLLKAIWTHLNIAEAINLIAVGGYGRGELHPQSDIDLLILSEGELDSINSQKVEQLVTLLWDIGLHVGHAVRTFKQCIKLAKKDITVVTSLTESRLLKGTRSLFEKLVSKTSPSEIWNAQSFYNAKIEEKKERYEKFDGSSYDLEPNLKSSPGGLRDIHLVGWIAQRCFYPKTLPMLIKENIISKKEYFTLLKCQLFLWKIRFALHTICNKPEDRLLFDHQKKLAELMGFKDSTDMLGVEKMMRRYYRSVLIIRNISELLLELLHESITKQENSFVTSSEVRVIDKDFQIIDNKIDVINTDCFSKNSSQLLYIFHVLANHPETDGITAKTLRAIRASRNKINKKFINNKVNQKLFLSFWSIKHQTARAMFLMKRNGILSDYLPSFKKISGQMQYDMFHSYTVDEHTLFLLRNLAEFTHENNKIKFPLCHEIMNRQEQPELIYLAGLFHDIGKGLGGDHSELGKAIALEFCEQHKMPVKDTEIITWLVENHLMMSLFSQKRDTSDPKVIESFAKLVDNQLKLELLYILTVADIRATNKTLWNSWKDSLLRELYLNTSAYLKNNNKESNEEISPNNKSNKSLWHINQIATKNELINNGYELEDIDALWELLGDRYFIKRSAEAVIWHTRIILDAPIDESIVVGIRKSGERNSNEVFIYTKDQADLFATLAASLNQQGLNIYGANIHTDKNGYCYDSFFVLNEQDKIITDTEVKEQIIQTIKKNVSEIKTKELNVSRRMPRQIKYFTVDTKIEFSADEFSHLTRIDITAKNQPGFLAAVGRVFVKNKIKLHDAKITTFGEKVEDTFLISDKNNQPIIDKGAQQNIRESIIEFLD